MQSTPNYLWSTEDLLGQGATAYVYKARNKVSGGNWGGRNPKLQSPGAPHPSRPRGCPSSAPLALPGDPWLGSSSGAALGFIFIFHGLLPWVEGGFWGAHSRILLAAFPSGAGGRSCFPGNAQRF